jgi:hypothetical protein
MASQIVPGVPSMRYERAAHVIAGGRLDGDDFRAVAEVLFSQGGASDQAAAAHRTENYIQAQLLPLSVDQHLAHQGGLTRNDKGVVKWVQECTFLLLCDLTRAFTGDFLAIALPVLCQDDSGAGALCELDLAPRRVVGHDDRDRYARLVSGKCKRLSEITRREGHHTALALLPGQAAHAKVGSSHLEGAPDLQRLGFEEDARSDQRVEVFGVQQRCPAHGLAHGPPRKIQKSLVDHVGQ